MRRLDPYQLAALALFAGLVGWGLRVAAQDPGPGPRTGRGMLPSSGGPTGSGWTDMGPVDWRLEGVRMVLEGQDGRAEAFELAGGPESIHVRGAGAGAVVSLRLGDGRRLRFGVDDRSAFLLGLRGVPRGAGRGDVPGGPGSRDNYWWILEGELHLLQGTGVRSVPVPEIEGMAYRSDRDALIFMESRTFSGPFYTKDPEAIARAVLESLRWEGRRPADWRRDWSLNLVRRGF